MSMDMDKLYKLREKLVEEMADAGSKGELSVGCLDLIKKLGECIEMVDEAIESSGKGSGERYGRGGMRRYGTGSYPGSGNWYGNNGPYMMNRGGYGHGGMDNSAKRQIEMLMNNARSDRLREILAEAYEAAENE